MTQHAIEVERVTKDFGSHSALADVSLTIPADQHTAILGPSGSGKSTLLKTIAGLEAPSTGSIKIDGRIVAQAVRSLVPPHERHLSLVFQDLALWPNLTIEQNVLLGLAGQRLSHADARRRAADALAACHIDNLANRRPGEASGGEQQRAALARALVVRPRYLLLDEPFSGIDLSTKEIILAEIRRLAVEHEATIVLVTHDPAEAVALCSRAYVLEEHRISDFGQITELIRSSDSSILAAFRRSIESITAV